MSLARKLYNIGNLVSDDEFISMLKTDFDASNYTTLVVNFSIDDNYKLTHKPNLKKASIDDLDTLFTRSIGGRGGGYFYLYPNFIYENKSDLYKRFKNTAPTFEKSVLTFANEANTNLARPIFKYIKNYDKDELELKNFKKDNYLLIFTINGKTIKELMPEILTNFSKNPAFLHSDLKEKEAVDYISGKKEFCGYNPDIKFFTFDNYHDKFKSQIINKLPLSQQSANLIKKGWIYTINNLKFEHNKLEYIVIPSMVNFDKNQFTKILEHLKSTKETTQNLEQKATKEDGFIRRLEKQSDGLTSIRSLCLDIYFTKVNLTYMTVDIFGSLENLIPSKIREVGNKMLKQKICDCNSLDMKKDGFVCLSDYFSQIELFEYFTKNQKKLTNRIAQEKIYLAKLLLGYKKIEYKNLLDRLEHFREFDFENRKKIDDKGIKQWMNFSNTFIDNENRTIDFLDSINALKRS